MCVLSSWNEVFVKILKKPDWDEGKNIFFLNGSGFSKLLVRIQQFSLFYHVTLSVMKDEGTGCVNSICHTLNAY